MTFLLNVFLEGGMWLRWKSRMGAPRSNIKPYLFQDIVFKKARKDGDVLNTLIHLPKNGRSRQQAVLRGFNEKQILVASPLWGLGLRQRWLPWGFWS